MKIRTHFAHRGRYMWDELARTFIERLAGIEDFEIAQRPIGRP
jgi:hypothetical protein